MSNNTGPLNVIVLCAEISRNTENVDLHISAFRNYSTNNTIIIDSAHASILDVNLELFEVLVLHYSIIISSDSYINEKLKKKIREFRGVKVLFVQDEYRWINRTSKAAKDLGVSVLFTILPKNAIRQIYCSDYFDDVRIEQTLTGFVPEKLLEYTVPNFVDRPIDIGYRARKLSGLFGEHALQKWKIGERILQDASKYSLKCDIAMSEASRIYGEKWMRFVSNCKATLGTESGASFADFSGQVQMEVEEYEKRHPDASFEEIKEKFLNHNGGEIMMNMISPRCFEAAALRTLMILYPGTYSGVLEPGRHYLELAPDHSNMGNIVEVLRNPDQATEIIQNAYDEVACSSKWTHRAFIKKFDLVVAEEMQKALIPLVNFKYSDVEVNLAYATIEMDSKKLAKSLHLKMKLVLLLQSIRVGAHQFIDEKLPGPVSRPLLIAGRFVTQRLKPIFKKILLKR